MVPFRTISESHPGISDVDSVAKGVFRPIRWKSQATYLEKPLLCLAIGPDPANNELRGHAHGVLAIGDFATGVVAVGAVARGLLAIGGVAVGGVVLGGFGVGVLAFAGLAMGWYAMGGLAVGYVAVGGLAVGYFALGGATFGKFVLSSMQRDPQAVEFFSKL